MIKKTFDFIVSLFFLIIFSPLILLIALLVRCNLGSPIIFSQLRPGLNENPFKIYKFRTMNNRVGSDNNLLPDDKRLTKFGTFLRRSSMDELPQLFNVIKGDISLVGPRPLLMEYLTLYSLEQKRRHVVKPGITGWAQVNGRNAISWEDKFLLDLWYVDHQSFWLDMKTIGLTIKKVLIKDGIGAKGGDTISKFTGKKLEKNDN